MERASDTDQAQLMLNETIFITQQCAQTCINPDKCSKSDLSEISSTVCRVFIALVFAKLKHLGAQSLYDALTEEFQKRSPSLFGSPGSSFLFNLFHCGRKAADMPLATVRQFEDMLYNQQTGKVRASSVWGIFEEINEAKVGGAVAMFVGGPCDASGIQKALLNHYSMASQMIEAMVAETSNK